jgi:ADP-ribose pyrophosphatase YjhB (NUDIX family)/predicted transcriptional regulator
MSIGFIKREKEVIFELFLAENRLKFSEIEKRIGIRSNLVAYYLKELTSQGLLKKTGEYYELTSNAEKFIPVFQYVTGKSVNILSVVLSAVVHKGKILLLRRNKRPYKDYWGIIGGRINLGESLKSAAARLVKEKSGLTSKSASLKAVMHERVVETGECKHGFMLFFAKVNVKDFAYKSSKYGELKWFNIRSVQNEKIIPSDLWLIKNKLSSRVDVKEVIISDSKGRIKRMDFV